MPWRARLTRLWARGEIISPHPRVGRDHILDAAVPTTVCTVDYTWVDNVLRMWWAEGHRWALDSPRVNPEDEELLHATLHHLATNGLPDDASSPKLGGGRRVRHH